MMSRPPVTKNDVERLARLTSYHIVPTEQDERLDQLTNLVASIFEVPMAIISILDQSKQWFKSRYGVELLETPKEISFCQYTILGEEIFEVPDCYLDDRFRDNPLVTGPPYIRFYCGAPLVSREGYILGSLGLLDREPRQLHHLQRRTLQLFAQSVVDHFELSRDKKELEATVARRTNEIHQRLHDLALKDEKLEAVHAEFTRFMYKTSHDLRGPLKTSLGLLNLALSESKDDTITNYLRLLRSTQGKLDTILDHILTAVHIKNHVTAQEPVLLDEFLVNVFQKASVPFKDRSLHFSYHIERVSILITDSFLLGVALEQILVNSIQHNTSETAVVSIRVQDQMHETIIEVTDNGPGIPEAEQRQVFDMFFKNGSSGTGLGLYLTKCAMEALQGEVMLKKSSSGGSIFSIQFPFPV